MNRIKFIKLLKKHRYFFNRWCGKGHGLYTNPDTKHTIMLANKHRVLSTNLVKKILRDTNIREKESIL